MSALGRLWELRDQRPRTVWVTLVTLAVFLAYPFVDAYLRPVVAVPLCNPEFCFNDYGAYSGGVARWLSGGEIYQRINGSFHGTYLYPPVTLLYFAAFQGIGFELSGWLMAGLAVGLLWVGLVAAIELLGLRLSWPERLLLVWPILGFQPVLYAIKLGQVSVLLAALQTFALVGLLFERRLRTDGAAGTGRRERLAGLVSGAFATLGSAFKIFYAPSGAHLLRSRRRLVGAFGTAGLLAVVSVAYFGVYHNLRYLQVLVWGKGWGAALPPWYWHAGYYKPLVALSELSPELSVAVRAVVLVGIVGLSIVARDGDADLTTYALGIAAIPFLAPTAYTHDFVVLLPAVAVLVAVEFRRAAVAGTDHAGTTWLGRPRPWLPVLALLLLNLQAYGLKLAVDHLPAGALWDTITGLTIVLQPALWGNLALLGLAAYRVAESTERLPVGGVPAAETADAPAATAEEPRPTGQD